MLGSHRRVWFVLNAIRSVLVALLLAMALLMPAGQVTAAEVARVSFSPATVEVGESTTAAVMVRVEGVSGLYGVDLTLRFDPAVVEAVDGDPSRDGVQLQLGDFLEPGFVVAQEADNVAGTARLVLTQLSPAEAKSGSGTLCTVLLRGKVAGSEGALLVEAAALSTQAGEPIAVSTIGGEVSVVATLVAPATPTTAPTVQPVVTLPTEVAAEAPTPTIVATQPAPTALPSATATATVAVTATIAIEAATMTATAVPQTPATSTATPVGAIAPTVTETSDAFDGDTGGQAAMATATVVEVIAATVAPVLVEAATATPVTIAVGTATTVAPAVTISTASPETAGAPVEATPMATAEPTATARALALADEGVAPASPTEVPAVVAPTQPAQTAPSLWLVLGPVALLIVGTGAVVVAAQSKRHRHV